jgi:uncharacterized protein
LGIPWTAGRKNTLMTSRINITAQLVNWLSTRSKKPTLMLSASAIGYYGVQPQNDETPLGEQQPPQPIFMSQLCQAWEAEAAKALALGIPVTLMRLGVVLGKGGALPMMLLPIYCGLGGPLGTGRQMFSWIHVDDVLFAIEHVINISLSNNQTPQLTCFNFTAPHPVSQKEFAQTAAKLLRRPSFWPTPAWLMRGLLGAQADLLLQGQRVVPTALLQSGYTFKFASLNEALTDIL